MCTRRSAPTLADPRSKSASREPSRAPCREAVDHRSGTRGSVEVVQLDDPLEAGLQVAILFEHPVILGADGLLDSDDLAAGRTVGFRSGGGAGCCRCVGPVLEDRQGALGFERDRQLDWEVLRVWPTAPRTARSRCSMPSASSAQTFSRGRWRRGSASARGDCGAGCGLVSNQLFAQTRSRATDFMAYWSRNTRSRSTASYIAAVHPA